MSQLLSVYLVVGIFALIMLIIAIIDRLQEKKRQQHQDKTATI